LKRLQTEGASATADVIFTKDLVYLRELATLGFFQAMNSAVVEQSTVDALRDPQGLWTAVSMRARTIMYNPARVDASELSTYEDLATDKWAGRVCLRTSKSSYNDALVGSFVAHQGYDKAAEIVKGLVFNLAVDPFANDVKVLEAIANGVCDVGIANTYYLAGVVAQNPNFPIKPFFANQNTTGVHVNGSGAGVAATSKQAVLATKFIETLMSDDIQLQLSGAAYEYPAKTNLTPNTLIRNWGSFKMDAMNWSDIGAEAANARKIMVDAEYN
jgi:iron(III) transport system substrate-binding protein